MNISFYGHVKQYNSIKNEIDANVQKVIESNSYVMGPMLKQFEEEFADYTGLKYAIGVGNGTDAIWLTILALGLKSGDEIITVANTFFATAEAIWIAGCKVVLVDCDEKSRLIDPVKVAAAVGPKTKAVIPVHLYGQCASMREIHSIAEKNNLKIIEDNAQAIDATGDNFKIGELSDAVTTSFIIQKNLGTFGDGGAVYTNNPDINSEVRRLHNHGSIKRDAHSFGFNSRLDDIHAAVLSAKLRHIKEWSDLRRKLAARYTTGLKDVKSITIPYEKPGYRHVYHLYVIETNDVEDRNKLLNYLINKGIDAKTHYSIPIHKQEGFPWGKDAEIRGSLKNAEKNSASCISLPMYPELTESEIDYVVEAVKSWDRDK